MLIDEQMISTKIWKIDIQESSIKTIINDITYPVKGDFYDFGIIDTFSINEIEIHKIAISRVVQVPTLKQSGKRYYIDTSEIKQHNYGYFLIDKRGFLITVNCNDFVKNLIKNIFQNFKVERFLIKREKFDELYDETIIKTGAKVVVDYDYKKFRVNVSSKEVDRIDIDELFGPVDKRIIAYNGKQLFNKDISFKMSIDGNIMIYNRSKNPIEWEDVFEFFGYMLNREG